MKKYISERKMPFFCISKGLSNKLKKISCHIHFKICMYFCEIYYKSNSKSAFSMLTHSHLKTQDVGRILERYGNS